jgi:hypothetical protein
MDCLSELCMFFKFLFDSILVSQSCFFSMLFSESVLEHFVHKVQCRGMFSTHYHRLAVDYQKDSKVCLYFWNLSMFVSIFALKLKPFKLRLGQFD